MNTHWKELEVRYLDPNGIGYEFTNHDVANELLLTPRQASQYIQAYTNAQTRKRSTTRYVLVRIFRTSSAVWIIGNRTADARDLTGQFGDDIRRRIERAIEPALARIAAINPRAVPVVQSALEPAVHSMGQMVEAMLVVAGWNGQAPS